MTQTERNDGGLYRSLVDLTWSEGWISQALADNSETSRDQVIAEYGADVGRIDKAEVQFLSCSPAARTAAEANARDCDDWDSLPQWYEDLADAAESADSSDGLTVDEGRAILAEVFGAAGWSEAERPGVYHDGELRDANHHEPARLESADAFRAQCREWVESFAE